MTMNIARPRSARIRPLPPDNRDPESKALIDSFGSRSKMTLEFVPYLKKMVVNLSDGKQFVVAPELMTMLGSGLGDASREAIARPLTTIAIDNLQERKR
jgi:hypothetical protein